MNKHNGTSLIEVLVICLLFALSIAGAGTLLIQSLMLDKQTVKEQEKLLEIWNHHEVLNIKENHTHPDTI